MRLSVKKSGESGKMYAALMLVALTAASVGLVSSELFGDGRVLPSVLTENGGAAHLDSERLRLTRANAEALAGRLRETKRLHSELSSDGAYWVVQADNLRACYSVFDGRLESFVYIRLGDAPVYDPDADPVQAAQTFLTEQRGCRGLPEVTASGKVGGYTVCELTCEGERWNALVDVDGRVILMQRAEGTGGEA